MAANIESLWDFVALGERQVPESVIRESAKSGIRNLLNWMRGGIETPSFSVDAELHTVPSHLLDAVAPVPDWRKAADSFMSILNQSAQSKEAPIQPVLVGPPGSATSQILNLMASREGYTVLTAPSPSDILQDGLSWLKHHPIEKGITYVIPDLEKFFLRHHRGLHLIRALMGEINNKGIEIIIGCDSWAWAYLTRVIGIHFGDRPVFVLKALDGVFLCNWFAKLAGLSCGTRFVFRSADTGKTILEPGDTQDFCSADLAQDENDQQVELHEIFKLIASRSRGIPLVAWAIWRQCLQVASDDVSVQTSFEDTPQLKPSTIWVAPWSKIVLPKLTSPVDKRELIMLHTLLIHSRLTDALLSELVPIYETERNAAMKKLKSGGLVKLDDEEWRVTLLGYPSVRDNLAAEGYLVDDI